MGFISTCNSELNVSPSAYVDLFLQFNKRGDNIRILDLHNQGYGALRDIQ